MSKCDVCFRECNLNEGEIGFCNGRKNENGKIIPLNYGKITSIALDPIEKKPLRRFYPGSNILSVGSFGCNLRCPFCQNHSISMAGFGDFLGYDFSPEKLCNIAESMQDRGNIGIAFTYNEPLIGYEFVRDTEKIAKEMDLKTVIVSNGTAKKEIVRELLETTDAMNIDLKAFSESYYRDVLKGNLHQVMDTIEMAAEKCHLELTTLIIPGLNDSEEEMEDMCSWIASLNGGWGKYIPLHISRYFPAYHMRENPTPISKIITLQEIAKKRLEYVYRGNC